MNYICLDIGNVICRIDFNKFISKISMDLCESAIRIKKKINYDQRAHDIGLLNLRETLENNLDITSPDVLDRILIEWNKMIVFDRSILDRFQNMSDKYGLKIALLSNLGFEHTILVREKLSNSSFEVFKNSIKYLSCEVGARKPQSIFFQSFLLRYPMFQGCIYLDDLQENLDASEPFGFRTMNFDLSTMGEDVISTKLDEIENEIIVVKKNSRRH